MHVVSAVDLSAVAAVYHAVMPVVRPLEEDGRGAIKILSPRHGLMALLETNMLVMECLHITAQFNQVALNLRTLKWPNR